MTTRDRIRHMISQKPMTRNEIANRLGVSRKTVSNRLAEIHSETFSEYQRGNSRQFYNILDDTRNQRRYFNIRPICPKTNRPYRSLVHGSRKFSLDRLTFTSDSETLAGVYKYQ